ncbi:MAG TPA: hypothetical protein VK454_05520 [Myxococcaceae bacterium]|nr:hypothetical protein [Myxococcaceae bacterium]
MATLSRAVQNLVQSGPLLREASASGNLRVLRSLLGPAFRGLVLQGGRDTSATRMPAEHRALFDWGYLRDHPALTRLYEAAKTSQWNAATDLDWSFDVDPADPERRLVPDEFHPVHGTAHWDRLTPSERSAQIHAVVAWVLSQFLHGEQGALFAACQVTEAVPWLDAKLYGSSQVVDEGRHVEVFHAYLTGKLNKLYQINDNLFTVIDALMTDGRWDIKFLGMQILLEGLALGAFGALRQMTAEPLLRQLLTSVITDEARHVHFGVLAIQERAAQLSGREHREREDWAFQMVLLLRNRFLAHEFWEEYWAHAMSRKAWDDLVLRSPFMNLFRRTMFKRIVPNLKRIGLLTERVRPRYEALGLLAFEDLRAAPELTASDLLEDR